MSFLIEGDSQNVQQGATSSNLMDSLYKDFLKDQREDSESATHSSQSGSDHDQMPRPDPDSDQLNALDDSQSSISNVDVIDTTRSRNQESSPVPQKLTVNQPIGRVTSCCAQGHSGPVTVSGKVEEISDEEIRNNRETEDGIRGISRFQNYQRGEPSNVGLLRDCQIFSYISF